jgi:small-conductance mechanosensitive channel
MNVLEPIHWWRGLAVALGCWALGWALRRFILPRLAVLLHKTPTDMDNLALDALRPHMPFWFLMLGVTLGARVAGLSYSTDRWLDRIAGAAVILSVSFALASFLSRWAISRAARSGEAAPATTLMRNVVYIVVMTLGLLVTLNNLGVQIGPILTALGVGSLAVGLALQPTLSNFFAGISIAMARHVRVGDVVELESGQIGEVTDIGWRWSQIRELPDNIILVPNAKLAELILRNYAQPGSELSVSVPCGVSYDSDLAEVERVALEVAREALADTPGAVAGFEPLVRFQNFGESAVLFNTVLRVRSYIDRGPVVSEFLKRLHVRFRAEGIEIPFPQRVLHLPEGDGAGSLAPPRARRRAEPRPAAPPAPPPQLGFPEEPRP